MNWAFDIQKVNFEQRLVEGCISEEIPDRQGDKIQYTAMCKALEEASAIGIREMHQPKAVGTLQSWWGDESTKKVYVQVYISNTQDGEDVLTKISEKVLRGFSIGAKALRWLYEGAVRVITELILFEISLVDVPANPGALITLVKFAGYDSSNLKEMVTTMPDNILKKGAGELLGEAGKAINEALEMIATDPEGAKQRLQQVGAALQVMADKASAPANAGEEKPTASIDTAAPSVGAMDKGTMPVTAMTMPTVLSGDSSGEVISALQKTVTVLDQLMTRMNKIEKAAIPANPAAPAGDVPVKTPPARSDLERAMIQGDLRKAMSLTGNDLPQLYKVTDSLVRESLVKSGISLGGRFTIISNPLE